MVPKLAPPLPFHARFGAHIPFRRLFCAVATSALKGSDPFTQFAIATLPITQRVNEVFLKIFGGSLEDLFIPNSAKP